MNSAETLKKAYVALKQTKERLAQLEAERHEPLAVIGMGCRFPGGADDPQKFWSLIKEGRDGTSEIPADRWPVSTYFDADTEQPGKMYVQRAGFLTGDVYRFDAGFFGLTPKEVLAMDPQQRLLLEVSWQAMENAGLDVTALRGSQTGVFIGVSSFDYATAHIHSGQFDKIDAYSVTGISFSTAAGRISYLFGFEGPSLAVDTACSSSLVALHLAAQSLRRGESRMALVGGVNLMLNPEIHIGFCKLRGISPDGRCKSFDAAADGHGRGEGCGVVLLKRLSDAQADGDNILAVIRGSAVNQDGRSNGMTAPNGEAQRKVILAALDNAAMKPEEVSFIEAHGTGTPLGDPIEMDALSRTYGPHKTVANPLVVSSVKANIGHLEASAGVAGIIKTVLILQHGQVPPQALFQNPNPHIDWNDWPVLVPKQTVTLPKKETSLAGAVSAFGFGGTNAHVILTNYAAEVATVSAQRPVHLLTLSAKSETTLPKLAEVYADYLTANTSQDLGSICHTAQTGRSVFPHRLTITGRTHVELAESLKLVTRGESNPFISRHTVAGRASNRVTFIFTGQGSQYLNMGRDLYESEPTFRATLQQCDEWLQANAGLSVVKLMYDASATEDALHQTIHTQPVIFSIGYALAQMWQSWGIKPAAVLGHSIGELTAACVAGVFTWQEALRLVTTRGRLIQSLPLNGAMGAIIASEARVREVIVGMDNVSIAAVNAPENTVIAGDKDAVETVMNLFKAQNIPAQKLRISHALHSPLMEPVLEAFEREASAIHYQRPKILVGSNVTGGLVADEIASAKYWRRQLREPVRFLEAIRQLHAQGHDLFLELGGTSTLNSLGMQCLSGKACGWVASLGANNSMFNMRPRRSAKDNDWEPVSRAAGELFVRGVSVDWKAFHGGASFAKVVLPNYPFEGQTFRMETLHAKGEPVACRVPASAVAAETTTATIIPVSQAQANQTLDAKAVGERLNQLIRHISGIEPSRLNLNSSWLELGLDSLMITRLRESVLQEFQVDMELSAFFVLVDTPEKLTTHVTQAMPVGLSLATVAASTNVKAVAPVAATSPNIGEVVKPLPGESLESLFARQMDAMRQMFEQQMALLRSVAQTNAPATSPAVVKQVPQANFRSVKFDDDTLTVTQREFLNQFIARYTQRTAKSKAFAQKNRVRFADWINSLGFRKTLKELVYPIVSARSEGSRIWDIDGNEYIDLAIGYGVSFFGNRFAPVVKAVQEQLTLGYELGPQNPLAGEVATLVAELTGVERVTFANTGSEAVMVALRVARTVTKRSRIVLFAGSYHGISDGVLAQPVEGGFSAPTAPGIPPEMVSQVMVLNYGTPESLEIIRKHAHELAAVLVEPVQSRRPGFQPREFLHELRQITQESGTVLIFDEMITGFRIHPGGAQAWFGVQADLVTYGKIPGGGLPIGIVSGKAQFMDAVDGGAWNFGDDSHPAKDMTFFAGTFCKHPLTMAAAKAILTHIRDHGDAPYADLRERSARFAERMNQFFIAEKIPFEIVHFGPLFRFESRGKFHVILQPLEMDLMFQLLLEKGIYTWERRICCWSMAHTQADMDQVAEAIIQTIRELRVGGFAIEESIIHAPAKKETAKTDLILAASPQRRIYVLDQMEDPANDPQSYQMTSGLWISGNLDAAKLENSLRQLLQRHEALRTSFELKDGELYQRIHPQVTFILEQKSAQGRSAETWFKEFSQRFDLGKAPLFRAWLIQFEDGKQLLLLASHHAVIDGLSWNRFVQEFLALYRGEALPPVARQYRDYCDWSAKHVTANSKSEQYWLKQFAGEIPVLDLPTDFSRSAQRSTQGGVVHFEVSKEVVERLKQTARQTNSTLFMVLLAAYQTLLHRLTNQTDLVIGTPAAGRPSSEFAEVVGMFANTLPLRSQIHADKSLREFITQVKQRVVEAFDHQDFAIDQLINKLNLARDTSRNALFDTIMVFEKGDDRVFQLPGLSIEPYRTPKAGNIADLCAEIVEQNGGLKIAFEFGTRLFKRTTIERWASYFQTLLANLPDSLDQSPSVIDILPRIEKQLLLDEWSRSKELAYDPSQTVLDLLSKHAKASPDKLAVACGKDCLTRAELDRLATRIAQTLLSRGMGEARRVGVCGVRSVETIAGMVGVMKAGGAFVPLDPEYPVERLKTILQDAGVKLLLTQRQLGERFRDLGVELVFLDDLGSVRTDAALPKVVPTDLAYCIYTSGSTGRPKGVLINHANLLYSNLARLEFYGHGAVESLLCVPSLAFDMAMASVIWPLCDGGLLVLPEEGKQRDVWYLSELIKRHRISHWLSVPSLYRLLLNETPVARLEPLKCVVVAGETCSVDLLRAHREKLPQTPVFNEFGPAEGTVWCSVERVDHLDYAQIPSVPIGQPIAGARIFLLNERQQPVPIGVSGELCFAGPGVAQGYLNHLELTAERFLASSLSGQPHGRIYRSGDFARYSESGRLEFIGRREGLVKVRGHRVELEEVEAVLRGLSGVREAAVGVITNDTGEAENLVAYLVMTETIADAADLKVRLATQLQAQLPAYMIPYEWMFLESLPLNTNGKVDRKRLPRPTREKSTITREFIAPRNEAEQALADVWREVLQVERIGVTDDYLELGGDSIKAIQIAARLRQKHFQLSVPDVFRFPTIALLATRVHRETVMEISTEATGEFPLSPIQHWFFDGFADANVNHFNQSILLEATGRLDGTAIQKALSQLVAQHDMLRATFPDKDGQRIQHVAESLAVPSCEIVDLTQVADVEATLRQHGTQTQATLNIATGPLWRVVIYRLAGGDKVLFITHHLMVDMLSWATLTADFAACYQATLENREPVLPPKTQPYRAWASEWSKIAATARIENADILAKFSANRPASDFPISGERAHPVQAAKSITLALSAEQTNAILQDANRAFNTRPAELALSALVIALRQWIGKPQMAIWLESHGRSETALSKLDVSRTVGWFTSFYPLAIDLPDDNDPAKQIVVVKESARKAADTGAAFGVQRYLAHDLVLATIKPFISFNFLGDAATPQLSTPFVRASEFRDAQVDAAAPRPVPVDCEVLMVDGCLKCHVTYNGGEFREETMQQFLENWRRALEQVIHFTAQRQSGAATPSDYTFKEMSVQQWEELLDDA